MVIVAAAAEDYHPNLLLEEGLDFILSHFEEPVWPRTISTKTTEGRQILVYNKEEALARFNQANFLDCRISAYPGYVEFEGINRQPPNFIFIDLDRSGFKTERTHKLALSLTLKNIKEKLGGANNPTVLWSGNGYHIYQPVEALVLEQLEPLARFDQPSRSFMRFAERYLSNGKSDSAHNTTVSFKNCMLRIPGSHNSKCVERNNDNGIAADESTTEVKIMQRWDVHHRPKINLLLGSFYAYLVDQKFKEMKQQQQKQQFSKYSNRSTSTTSNSVILWIEKLLQTPIEDHRKITVSLILTPYLVNIKKLPYDESYDIINGWLDKCNSLRRLDSGFSLRIKHALKSAIKTGYKPMRFENLKKRNMALYNTLL
jgi:Primase X